MGNAAITKPPEGFVLDEPESVIPDPPQGFALDEAGPQREQEPTGVLTTPFLRKKEQRPGVWGLNQQLDGLFSGRANLADILPLEITHDFGRVVGMTDTEDLEAKAAGSIMYSVMFDVDPKIAFDNIDSLNKHIFGKELSALQAVKDFQATYTGSKITLTEKLKNFNIVDALAKLPFSPLHDWEKKGADEAERQLRTGDYGQRRYAMGGHGFAGFRPARPKQTRTQLDKIVDDYTKKTKRGQTIPSSIFDGVTMLPAYMMEFAAGGAAAKEIGIAAKGVKGLFAAGGVRTVLQPHRVASAVIDQTKKKDQGPVESLFKAYGDVYIENLSEAAGEGFVPLLKKLPLGSKLMGALTRIGKKLKIPESEVASRIAKKGGWNGLVSEWGEERLATELRAIFDVEDFGAGPNSTIPDRMAAGFMADMTLENQLIEIGVLSVPFGAKMITSKIINQDPVEIEPSVAEIQKAEAQIAAEEAQQAEHMASIAAEAKKPAKAGVTTKAAKIAPAAAEPSIKAIPLQTRELAIEMAEKTGKNQFIRKDRGFHRKTMPPKTGDFWTVTPQGEITFTPAEVVKPAIKKQKQKIAELQSEILTREAEQTDEQLSGITKKRRRSLVKQTAARIKTHDLFQAEVIAQAERGQQIGAGFYYIHESGRGEVEAVLENIPKGSLRNKIKKMFTFERNDLQGKGGTAIAWDTAVQEGLETEFEQQADIDLSEFVQRVADAVVEDRKFAGLNRAALDAFAKSGFPEAELLSEKFRMLQRGASDIEINEMITRWAQRNDVPLEVVLDEFVNADKMIKIAELPEVEQDAEIERLATEQILAEDQIAAEQSALEVLEANDIEAEVRTVEEITEEDLGDVPFERRERPTGAAMTQGQREVILLAMGADIETGAHEGWHLLRGRLTNEDLATLMDKYGVGLQGEEAEAAAFGRFFKNDKAPSSAIRKIFEKIKRILAKIKSALEGKGFRTVEDIFGEAVIGKIAKQQARDRRGTRFEISEAEPVFFSKLKRAVTTSMPNKMTSEAFRGWAAKQGIKKEELLWTGVDELLTKQENVTKQEIHDTIELNEIEIDEVVKGGKAAEKEGRDLHQINVELGSLNAKKNDIIIKIKDTLNDVSDLYLAEKGYTKHGIDGVQWEMDTSDSLDTVRKRAGEVKKALPDLSNDIDDYVGYRVEMADLDHEEEVIRSDQEFGGAATQFAQYKLPGGENYREVLLRLGEQWEAAEMDREAQAQFGKNYDDLSVQHQREIDMAVDTAMKNRGDRPADFTAGHFAETNVLAHFRMTDRTDKGGAKVLFIEEIQSDWHQKGRELGYRGTQAQLEWEAVTDLEEKGKLAEKQWISVDGSYQIIYSPVLDTPTLKPYTPYLIQAGRRISLALKTKTLEKAKQFAQDHREGTSQAVPDAPFKRTWHELAFKRILRFAADEGYDKVAWTTGEIQAVRYPSEMRKVVDTITWDSGTGEFDQPNLRTVNLEKDGESIGAIFVNVESGKITGGRGSVPTDIVNKQLSEAIGKDMAAMVLKNQTGQIKGDDFVIGNKGMYVFYDLILPAFAKKYMKKWGVKGVGETGIRVPTSLDKFLAGKAEHTTKIETVHSVPVTEPMKESVQAGQVRFETSGQRLRREAEQNARINARKARIKAQAELIPTKKKKKKVSRARLKIKLREVTPAFTPDLENSVVPGQAFVTAEPAPGKGKTPKKTILTEQFLEQNRQKYKKGLGEFVSEKAESFMLGFDKAFRAMSSRLEKIDPKLKFAVRKYIFNLQTRTIGMVKEAAPMVKAWKKFSKADKRDFKFAALNGWSEKIQEIIEKNGAQAEYQQYRSMMDEIFQAGNSVGLEILYDAEHWPRVVKDFKGLTKHLMTTDKWSAIQQALFKRQEQAGGRELTDQEKAQVINTLLRGFKIGGVTLSRPGAARERTIEVFDNKIEPYYHDFETGLQIYIQDMMQSIGSREFFGKETKQIRDLRAQKARLATRLFKTSTRIGLKEPITLEKHEIHISEARKKFQEVSERLAAFKTQTIEDSVGWAVNDLFLAGKIDYQQQQQVAEMFRAIFEPRGMTGAVRLFTKLGYIDLLANPEVAMTQLEEAGLSFYRSKFGAAPAITRAFTGKSRITNADMGVDDINQFMQDLGFNELGDKLLFMMRSVDMPLKEAFANTAVSTYITEAKKSTLDPKFRKLMDDMFGAEAGQVIEDLRTGIVSENVKFLAFSELADMQPIAITETPQFYARGGNQRVWYMLRSFTLRRLDMLLTKAKRAAVNPIAKPEQFVKAVGDIMHYLAILTAFGVGKDVLRAWFHGQPFGEDEFKDSVIDNLLQFVLLSRWTARRAKQEGLGRAVAEEIFPPTKGIDAVIRDVKNGELNRTVRSIPLVGEPYFWWFGGGSGSGGGKKVR